VKSPSPHVQLRDVEPGDLPALFQHQRDPEANRMAVANARDEDAFNQLTPATDRFPECEETMLTLT
jgi:hypothetical protein